MLQAIASTLTFLQQHADPMSTVPHCPQQPAIITLIHTIIVSSGRQLH
jgi:hypothetical protein